MDSVSIRRALISVSDKTGLAEFVGVLAERGVEILSTGGTRKHLQAAGLDVRDVSAYTGFPEMMDGRLKTLHPKIFGGILCRHDRDDDMAAMAEHEIGALTLVVVNLYPFTATIARAGVTDAEAIEQIDIGGPSLVRAAAKNHRFVTIATSPSQYDSILAELRRDGATTLDLRRRLAGEAFAHTAEYDRVIADYFARADDEATFPATLQLSYRRTNQLRYGENPHQQAAVYQAAGEVGASVIGARQLSGKELSYNNLLDLDSALAIARSFSQPSAVVIKHNNPCGLAIGATQAEAVKKALDGDPVSAFGSVLGFNLPVEEATARVLCEPGLFIEALAAPTIQPEAVRLLTTEPKWKNNVRLIEVGPLDRPRQARQLRFLEGGVLLQGADFTAADQREWKVVTQSSPDERLMDDLRFAWEAVRHVKSNAIVLCKEGMLRGAGAGQMSRVDSVDIAIRKAGSGASGSVLASDAFFPFPDSIHIAADAGIVAVIQPGGSRRDDEVIAACNERKLPMVFTGRRHFKH